MTAQLTFESVTMEISEPTGNAPFEIPLENILHDVTSLTNLTKCHVGVHKHRFSTFICCYVSPATDVSNSMGLEKIFNSYLYDVTDDGRNAVDGIESGRKELIRNLQANFVGIKFWDVFVRICCSRRRPSAGR